MFSFTYPKNRITLCLWIFLISFPHLLYSFSCSFLLFSFALCLANGIFVIFASSHVETCMARGCKISPEERKKKIWPGLFFMNHYPRTWHISAFYVLLPIYVLEFDLMAYSVHSAERVICRTFPSNKLNWHLIYLILYLAVWKVWCIFCCLTAEQSFQ